MKQNIKIFLIALVLGMVVAFVYCYKFDNTLEILASNGKAICFDVGAYNNMESAKAKQKEYSEAIIYQDEGIYRVVIGVYSNSRSAELMSSYFRDMGINFNQFEVKVSPQYKNMSESYELLIKSSSKEMYENINSSLLKLFNEYIN
ncbi:MAG: hypothetical protein K2J20_01735 [Bacilli bacterium]|nr:hypothetical protein [Bacilli bacterium]